MTPLKKFLWAFQMSCLIGVGFLSTAVRAEFRQGTALQPTDQITTLAVKLDVGKEGDALDEPVALDLGLGFPLWLEPVGHTTDSVTRFGAVPQQSTAKETIAAGGSATFTFSLAGADGQDRLRTTPQLLDGIQVSDIARIGFIARGDSNWDFAGYAIEVNNQLLAANDAVNQKVGDVQQRAQFQIASVGLKIAPLKNEAADLQALKDASLATDQDLARLAEVVKNMIPLAQELRRLEGQVAGRYPWFSEPAFAPEGSDDSQVKTAKVTLLTSAHTGAGTKNYVYFQTGGKKYLLASPTQPLTSSLGPQTFDLDLLSGPLTAGQLRDYGLGMLAHGEPFGKTPDRWHPQRMLLEVDGSVVYDSEERPYDRKSLAAIRLIPPAQLDTDGQLVSNDQHTLREFYVWQSGKGLGLDLLDGRPLPLPEADDPGYPDAEPGLPDDSGQADSGDSGADDASPDDGGADDSDLGPSDDGFPGEEPLLPPPDENWDDGSGGFPWPPWGGLFPWPPWGANPPPAGIPPQVKNARITSGWRTSDAFLVEWDVAFDESQVKQYHITLFAFHPELPAGQARVPIMTRTATVGVRSTTFAAVAPVGDVDYFIALVVAELNNGTFHAEWTPARAVFPPATDPVLHQLQFTPLMFRFRAKGALPQPWQTGPISIGIEPGGNRGVWTFGREQSHIDVEFDDPFPGPAWNVAWRPDPTDAEVELSLSTAMFVPAGPPMKFKFVTYVGFVKGKGAWNTATFNVTTRVTDLGGNGFGLPGNPTTVTHPLGGVPQPMQKIEVTFDSSMPFMGPGAYLLQIDLSVNGGELDPNHPPAFFGARFVPQ